MVNKVVLNYLRKHSGKYRLDRLKNKIIKSGYSKKEVDEAVKVLGLERTGKMKVAKPGVVKPRAARVIKKPVVNQVRKPVVNQVKKPVVKKVSNNINHVAGSNINFADKSKTWLKIAAIAGILVFVFPIIAGISQSIQIIAGILTILGIVSMGLFYYGFFVLGKKYSGRLLKITSIIFIVFIGLSIVANILMMIYMGDINNAVANRITSSVLNPATLDFQDVMGTLITSFLIYILIGFSLLLIILILGILFGVGVLKLKENVRLAKATGILYIIGFATLIIGVGALVLLVAHILGIILLFKASKQA